MGYTTPRIPASISLVLLPSSNVLEFNIQRPVGSIGKKSKIVGGHSLLAKATR